MAILLNTPTSAQSKDFYVDFFKRVYKDQSTMNFFCNILSRHNIHIEPKELLNLGSICLPKLAIDEAINGLGLVPEQSKRSACKLEELVSLGFDIFALVSPEGEIEFSTWTSNIKAFDDWIELLNQAFPMDFKHDGSIYHFADIMADLSLMRDLIPLDLNQISQFYDFKVTNTEGESEVTYVANENDRQCPHCSECGKYISNECKGRLQSNGFTKKSIRCFNVVPGAINFQYTQLKCPHSVGKPITGLRFSLFEAPIARVTWSLVYSVLRIHDCCPAMSASESAKFFGIDEELVKALLNCHYLCKLHKTPLPECERLVIDEFLAKTGYMTIAVDADCRKPVCLFEGRCKEQIKNMFQHLKLSGREVKIIASDDHAPFRRAAEEVFGKENLLWVLDNFHVQYKLVLEQLVPRTNSVKTLDRKLANNPDRKEYAIDVANHIAKYEGKEKIIFNRLSLIMRYTKSRKHLMSKNLHLEQIEYICNHPILGQMLDIREGLSNVYNSQTLEEGAAALDLLITKVEELIAKCPEFMKSFKKFLNTLINRRDGILAYISTKLTSSMVEGFNCKIKLLKRSQRGVKNSFSFMLRCMFAF